MKLTHLEYSFILHTCRLGDRVRTRTNPFTGEAIQIPIDDGLTADERENVTSIFAEFGVTGPEPEGEGYVLYLDGHGTVRFRGGFEMPNTVPVTSVAVEIVVKQLTEKVLQLILQIARNGNMVLMSSVGDHVGLVNDTSDSRIKMRWPDSVSIPTAASLREWLDDSIGARNVHVPPRN